MLDAIEAFNSIIPKLIFHKGANVGHLENPVTGEIVLRFPPQEKPYLGYPVHTESALSQEFSSYLYGLVNDHILFQMHEHDELVCISDEDLINDMHEKDTEFSIVYLRSPLEFRGLPDYFDTIGFCFLDGELHAPLYCELVEVESIPQSKSSLPQIRPAI